MLTINDIKEPSIRGIHRYSVSAERFSDHGWEFILRITGKDIHYHTAKSSFTFNIRHIAVASILKSQSCPRIEGVLPDVLVILGYAPWKQISSLTTLASTLSMEICSGSRTLEAPRGNRYAPARGMR